MSDRIPCPFHKGEDKNFERNKDGSGHCFSQCSRSFSAKEVAAVLGEEYIAPAPLDFETFAKHFNFNNEDIKKWNIKNSKNKEGIEIPYCDPDGNIVAKRYRHSIAGKDRFSWQYKTSPILFGLQHLDLIKESGVLVLVEGETDTIAAWRNGIYALGIAGASTFRPEWVNEYGLDQFNAVYIWHEKDEASYKLIEKISKVLPEAKVIQHPKYKDIAEINRLGLDVVSEFKLAKKEITTAKKFADRERQKQIKLIEAIPEFKELIKLPEDKFNSKLYEDIDKVGFVGDASPVVAVMLSITSKLLPKPFHIQLLAPSGSGKTFAVETAIKLFSQHQIHRISAATEGAWIYDKTDISEKALFVEEMDSLPQGNSPIASAVRKGMNEGAIEYASTVEDKDEGRRLVQNKRPCRSIITTGIRTPETQTMTRELLMDVDYSKDQIIQNMLRQAKLDNESIKEVPATHWQYYFDYLNLTNDRYEVTIPFSEKLAKAIVDSQKDALDERWNRDFAALLRALQTSAIIHQRFREKEGDTIVAAAEDYIFVYKALARAFSVTQRSGVNDSEYKFLETITEMQEQDDVMPTQQAVADKLGISAPRVSQLVRRLGKKWITVNKAPSGNKNILHVDHLPDMVDLPEVEEVFGPDVDVSIEIKKEMIETNG